MPFRTLMLVSSLLAFLGCEAEPAIYEGDNFLIRDGVTYDPASDRPISGVVIERYESGRIRVRSPYADGKLSGLVEEFYETGQLRARETFVDGIREGLSEYFFGNGQLSARGTYVDGERDGINEEFYTTGQLKERWTLEPGKKREWQEETFYASGELGMLVIGEGVERTAVSCFEKDGSLSDVVRDWDWGWNWIWVDCSNHIQTLNREAQ